MGHVKSSIVNVWGAPVELEVLDTEAELVDCEEMEDVEGVEIEDVEDVEMEDVVVVVLVASAR